ncbi:tRNA pseudouridine(55) synthase TruB [Hugenholtzia roseola]|uniref:tRNA pseudouridine(55) synthase TruB n=1 Tax=Hugenholtzia roseola TaxID=1002 RepID=UPI00041B088B|nr:tRNA pseudouridine(55) synthase TruB [Hugenholtzia roseola]
MSFSPLISPQAFQDGQVLLLDKPYTWTSFDVVNKLRYALRRFTGQKNIKVGHAGTLDPLATGLLLLCTGKMTKQIDAFQAQEKTYTGSFCLGATTPSYDKETEITTHHNLDFLQKNIKYEAIQAVIQSFIGKIEQVPPLYSAVSVEGKRAYQAARKGESLTLKSRPIEIFEFEVEKIELPEVFFRVRCSKGTYIRSLAQDVGQKLGVGAYLSSLRRTQIGDFKVENALAVPDFLALLKES